MTLTGTFGATKATELASTFTAADLRVSTEIDFNGSASVENEATFSNEGPTMGSLGM